MLQTALQRKPYPERLWKGWGPRERRRASRQRSTGENPAERPSLERGVTYSSAKRWRPGRTYNRAGYDAEKRQAVVLLGDLVERVLAGEERGNVVRIG
jgi:hypothetical protein